MACAGFSRADIIGNSIAADGDGVMSCYTCGFLKTGNHAFQLSLDGSHNSWDVGHIQDDIITDTESDPTLTLDHQINNDTGVTWNDYHVKVTMNKSFSFSNPEPKTFAIAVCGLAGLLVMRRGPSRRFKS